MTPDRCEHAKAQALAGYRDPGPGHLNCAQAVVLSGLLIMDQDPESTSVAGYLGGGMARMGEACGALTGAAVALGMRDLLAPGARPKNSAFDPLQRLIRDFEANFGAVTCRGLLGCDISSAEGFREAKRCQALNRCPEFVAWTIDRVAEIMCDKQSEMWGVEQHGKA
jgi:C_GCAxxG_C_C family probable redox protein